MICGHGDSQLNNTMTDNPRRNRTQSLPHSINKKIEKSEGNKTDLVEKNQENGEEILYEGVKLNRKPFEEEEVEQAHKLSEEISSTPASTCESPSISTSSNLNSSSQSLIGSIYSIGGAVWSFIRGT